MKEFDAIAKALESQFSTNIHSIAYNRDCDDYQLKEIINVPHRGVWRGLLHISQNNTFLLGGVEGKISMYDTKTLKLLDAI